MSVLAELTMYPWAAVTTFVIRVDGADFDLEPTVFNRTRRTADLQEVGSAARG